jgi:phosphohistidine phosphatase
MKTLFLVRHAKSSWANETISDIDRPLNERGYADAKMVSMHLFQKNFIPEIIFSSPAVRALTTALIFSRTLNYSEEKIVIEKKLYESKTEDYLECIASVNDNFQSAMFVGHNNNMDEVAHFLCPSFADEMKTCAVLGIVFNADSWKNILPQNSSLQLFVIPSHLKEV